MRFYWSASKPNGSKLALGPCCDEGHPTKDEAREHSRQLGALSQAQHDEVFARGAIAIRRLLRVDWRAHHPKEAMPATLLAEIAADGHHLQSNLMSEPCGCEVQP